MGEVYLAEDRLIQRRIALKFLHLPEDTDAEERSEAVARFYREARAAGRLSHPNIVVVHDICEVDGRPCISMEYLEGETLRKIMSRGPVPVQEAVDILHQVLEALDYAHRMGVVHRDVKPENIFLTPGGTVKLTDFGIARLMDTPTMTDWGRVIGTPGYMSPEQVKGEPVDHRTDIFACGVLLYEMLSGRKAFAATSLSGVLYKIVHEELPSLEDVDPSLAPHFDEVIRRATAKDPGLRYSSASEMASDLYHGTLAPRPTGFTRRLEDEGREPVPPGGPHMTAASKGAPGSAALETGGGGIGSLSFPAPGHGESIPDILVDRKGRKRKVAILAAIAFLLIGGLLAWLLSTRLGKPEESREKSLITQAYRDLLGREPDPVGLKHYLSRMEEGWVIERVRADIMASEEYRERLIIQAYRDLLGRDPDPVGLEHYTELMKGGWTIEQVREDIMSTEEYMQRLIIQAYRDLLGRDPDPVGLEHYTELMKGGWTIEQVREDIMSTEEYREYRGHIFDIRSTVVELGSHLRYSITYRFCRDVGFVGIV